jgi:dipeptidyl-peptidase 4
MPAHLHLLRARLVRVCAATSLTVLSAAGLRAQQTHVNRANWTLADKFTPEALRPILYSSSVSPHWIGKTDSMWYNWKDHTGSAFYLVVPSLKVRRPLFDQVKMAAALTAASGHAYDAYNLPFTSVDFGKDHKTFEFNADSSRWEWTLATEMLRRVGPARREAESGRGGR